MPTPQKSYTTRGSSFHPDHDIGQGDTPLTLILIAAAFDILLTLLETTDTGETHAYTNDLVNLAPSLAAQQNPSRSYM